MTKAKDPKDKKIGRERQLAEDWQHISRSPEGRRVLADLMAWGWVFQPIEEDDPIAMARANGERNFVLRIARYLNLQPEVFAEAMRDNDEAQGEMIGDHEYRQLMAKYLRPGPVMN